MNTEATKCACPDCKCEVREGHRVAADGKNKATRSAMTWWLFYALRQHCYEAFN